MFFIKKYEIRYVTLSENFKKTAPKFSFQCEFSRHDMKIINFQGYSGENTRTTELERCPVVSRQRLTAYGVSNV